MNFSEESPIPRRCVRIILANISPLARGAANNHLTAMVIRFIQDAWLHKGMNESNVKIKYEIATN